jgi:hypothetical protein
MTERASPSDAIGLMTEAHKAGVRAFAEWVAKNWQRPREEWNGDAEPPTGDYADGFNAGVSSVPDAVDCFFEELF